MLPIERGRDLDAAVAVELFGWHPLDVGKYPMLRGENWYINDSEPGVACCEFECYSTSPDSTSQVEAEIERRGLVDAYVRNLRRVLYAAHGDDTIPQLWRFATATPEQRCLAALAAVREAKGSNNAD